MSITVDGLMITRKTISETIRTYLPKLAPMEVHKISNRVYDNINCDTKDADQVRQFTLDWLSFHKEV